MSYRGVKKKLPKLRPLGQFFYPPINHSNHLLPQNGLNVGTKPLRMLDKLFKFVCVCVSLALSFRAQINCSPHQVTINKSSSGRHWAECGRAGQLTNKIKRIGLDTLSCFDRAIVSGRRGTQNQNDTVEGRRDCGIRKWCELIFCEGFSLSLSLSPSVA